MSEKIYCKRCYDLALKELYEKKLDKKKLSNSIDKYKSTINIAEKGCLCQTCYNTVKNKLNNIYTNYERYCSCRKHCECLNGFNENSYINTYIQTKVSYDPCDINKEYKFEFNKEEYDELCDNNHFEDYFI